MDKIMWLKVIREELAILDQLAAGMIEDAGLTREEVELAITRSKIVVNEFEVLYKQLSVTTSMDITPAWTAPAPSIEMVSEPLESAAIESSENAHSPEEAPTHEIEISVKVEAAKEITQVEEPIAEDIDYRKEAPTVEVVAQESPVKVAVKAKMEAAGEIIPEVDSVLNNKASEPADQNIMNIEDHKEYQPQFKAVPLKSLKEGLSLNDRYLFQRELFDNDKAKLDDAISALDSLVDIREAVSYLKANFKWTRSEASEKFVHLVKRRFS